MAALLASERGRDSAGKDLAREAVALADTTDHVHTQAIALSTLGDVLDAAGQRDEALAAWQRALERFDRKELVGPSRRLREHIGALRRAR